MITYEVKVYANGSKYWYLDGKRHREDGPAIEYASGSKEWYLNDKLHREDGPACEYPDGDKLWYLNGVKLTEAEFNEQMNPVKEYSIVDLEKILGHRVKVIK